MIDVDNNPSKERPLLNGKSQRAIIISKGDGTQLILYQIYIGLPRLRQSIKFPQLPLPQCID